MATCPEVRTTSGYASWGKVVQVPAAACMAGCLEWVLDVFCAMLTIIMGILACSSTVNSGKPRKHLDIVLGTKRDTDQHSVDGC